VKCQSKQSKQLDEIRDKSDTFGSARQSKSLLAIHGTNSESKKKRACEKRSRARESTKYGSRWKERSRKIKGKSRFSSWHDNSREWRTNISHATWYTTRIYADQ